MPGNEKGKIFLDFTDKSNNYFSITNDVWFEHIVSEHPEMAGEQKLVKKALEDPDFICIDKNPLFDDTRNFYKDIRTTRLGLFNDYLKVCFSLDNRNVKSAYPVGGISPGDTIVYTKNDENEN